MKHYAGLDWGSMEHATCVVDEQGAAFDAAEPLGLLAASRYGRGDGE